MILPFKLPAEIVVVGEADGKGGLCTRQRALLEEIVGFFQAQLIEVGAGA